MKLHGVSSYMLLVSQFCRFLFRQLLSWIQT